MSTDAISQQIQVMFRAAAAFPQPGTLSKKLGDVVENAPGKTSTIIDAEILTCFATASVDMWHRSVHSFLVSASLTRASSLWASVSGYYSSHYSVRAFAHLLGYFQLYKKKRIMRVEVQEDGSFLCHIIRKNAGDSEHKFYWKTIKEDVRFPANPFFTKNNLDSDHRNMANYADHINNSPTFQVLDEPAMEEYVKTISYYKYSNAEAIFPKTKSYPDTENVQSIAYYRLAQFRQCVDKALGSTNLFWTTNRRPEWCPSFLDFKIPESELTNVDR